MKKIFTLFTALMVASSMFALNVEHLYLVGDGTTVGWDNNTDNWLEFDSDGDGLFSITTELNNTGAEGFKIVSERNWLAPTLHASVNGMLLNEVFKDTVVFFCEGEGGDYKWKVSTTGTYTIKVEVLNNGADMVSAVVSMREPNPEPEVYTYYFKHPWNGGEWTWKEAADTTFLGIEASYVVAQWGDNGFNFHTAAEDAGAQWYEKEIIGTISPDGVPAIGYPSVGTEVTFICLHDDHTHVVGGGRAWIVYQPATALQNNAAGIQAAKRLENGQVVIIRGGERYNIVGAKF